MLPAQPRLLGVAHADACPNPFIPLNILFASRRKSSSEQFSSLPPTFLLLLSPMSNPEIAFQIESVLFHPTLLFLNPPPPLHSFIDTKVNIIRALLPNASPKVSLIIGASRLRVLFSYGPSLFNHHCKKPTSLVGGPARPPRPPFSEPLLFLLGLLLSEIAPPPPRAVPPFSPVRGKRASIASGVSSLGKERGPFFAGSRNLLRF